MTGATALVVARSIESSEFVQCFLNDLCFWDAATTCVDVADRLKSKKAYQKSVSGVSETPLSGNFRILEMRSPRIKDLRWQSAVDPVSCRVYYFDVITMERQWKKPPEIKEWEKQQKRREAKKKQHLFFRDMELNIYASQQRGEPIPGMPTTSHEKELSAPQARPQERTISKKDDQQLLAAAMNNHGNKLKKVPSTTKLASTASALKQQKNNREGRPPLPKQRSQKQQQKQRENSPKLRSQEQEPSSQEKAPLDVATTGAGSGNISSSKMINNTQIKMVSPPPAHIKHKRHNSYVNKLVGDSTIINPDVAATIKCVCAAFRAYIVQGKDCPKTGGCHSSYATNQYVEMFRDDVEMFRDDLEQVHPKQQQQHSSVKESFGSRTTWHVPTLNEIVAFYTEYYETSKMQQDTIIISLIYLERLIKHTNGILRPQPDNWRSLLFSCMILACKVWDDFSMWNIDFCKASASTKVPFSLRRINNLEVAVLACLDFDVRVMDSEYARYYFLIRTLMIRSSLRKEKSHHNNNNNNDDDDGEDKNRNVKDINAVGKSRPILASGMIVSENKARPIDLSLLGQPKTPKDRRTKSADWTLLSTLSPLTYSTTSTEVSSANLCQ